MSDTKTSNRSDFKRFYPIHTRWHDNDIYGHVNNVTYYSFFDTAVNQYLIEDGGLDIHRDQIVGYVVNSSCQYFKPIKYPNIIEVGIRVNHLGNKSVEYGVAVFYQAENQARALGTFTHVFVDQQTGKSAIIPEKIRLALADLTAS